MFESVGGNFVLQTVTVEGSVDNTNWVTVHQFGLPNGGNLKAYRYIDSIGTQDSYNSPLDYQYIRITVPALGSGISCILTYGGKP